MNRRQSVSLSIVCILSVSILNGLGLVTNWLISIHTKWNSQSLSVSPKWPSVLLSPFSHLFEGAQYSSFQKLRRFLLRVAASANFLLLHVWIHVRVDHLQMDRCVGRGERDLWGSFSYCANDRFAVEDGFDLGQAFVGYAGSVILAVQLADYVTDLRAVDAHLQAAHHMGKNAKCPTSRITPRCRGQSYLKDLGWPSQSQKDWEGNRPQEEPRPRRTRHFWNRCASNHRNNRICPRKYLQHSFIPPSLGLVLGPRSALPCLLAENNRRGYIVSKHDRHRIGNVLLLQHLGGSHHGHGHNGVLPARSPTAVGRIRQQIFQGRWKKVHAVVTRGPAAGQRDQVERGRLICF